MLRNNYSPREIDGTKYIWLQGVGWHSAKPAGEIKAGDNTVWNYGNVNKVTRIVKETVKTVVLEVEARGKLYEKRVRKSTLIATCD